VHRFLPSPRALRFGVVVVTLVVLSAVVSGGALAKTKSCADKVIADWYDDGRIKTIYPLECYRKAIASLPPDVVDYSNAKEEIGRALAFAKQGKPDPGGEDPTPATTSTSPASTDTTKTSTTTTSKTDTSGTDTSPTESEPQTTDTSGPSSVPIPLLVLGGLAVLLLAAGSAGYLRRRMGSDGDDDSTPPAAA
jgi:cobalamin biosynthesis Mg chelatase CobN